MDNKKLLSYLGAALAVVCILFAPVVGCGETNLNGLQIIQDKGVGTDIKLFIIIAIICGIVIFFLRKHLHLVASAIVGAIALLIAYLIAHSKNEGIELRYGSILAFIGYAVVAITNFLGMSEKKEVDVKWVNKKDY